MIPVFFIFADVSPATIQASNCFLHEWHEWHDIDKSMARFLAPIRIIRAIRAKKNRAFACENREIRVFRARINLCLSSARMARYRQVDGTISCTYIVSFVLFVQKRIVLKLAKIVTFRVIRARINCAFRLHEWHDIDKSMIRFLAPISYHSCLSCKKVIKLISRPRF